MDDMSANVGVTKIGIGAPSTKTGILYLDDDVARVLDLWDWPVLKDDFARSVEDDGAHRIFHGEEERGARTSRLRRRRNNKSLAANCGSGS